MSVFKKAGEIKENCFGVGDERLDRYIQFCERQIHLLYGPPGAGKTNFAMSVCAFVSKFDNCVYVYTESMFPSARLEQIVKHKGGDMDRVFVAKAETVDQLFEVVKNAHKLDFKLMVVDSIMAPFRTSRGYVGLRSLHKRQSTLAVLVGDLRQLANKKNASVVAISHLVEAPGIKTHSGGHVLAHLVTTIYGVFRTADGGRYVAVIKHPSMPEVSIPFRIFEGGVCST